VHRQLRLPCCNTCYVMGGPLDKTLHLVRANLVYVLIVTINIDNSKNVDQMNKSQ
jgi:hypothetical protein